MIFIDCFKYAVFFKTPKKKKKEMKQMFGENFATALIFMMAKTFWYTEFVLRYVNVFKQKSCQLEHNYKCFKQDNEK